MSCGQSFKHRKWTYFLVSGYKCLWDVCKPTVLLHNEISSHLKRVTVCPVMKSRVYGEYPLVPLWRARSCIQTAAAPDSQTYGHKLWTHSHAHIWKSSFPLTFRQCQHLSLLFIQSRSPVNFTHSPQIEGLLKRSCTVEDFGKCDVLLWIMEGRDVFSLCQCFPNMKIICHWIRWDRKSEDKLLVSGFMLSWSSLKWCFWWQSLNLYKIEPVLH